jgi:hypothetical protein
MKTLDKFIEEKSYSYPFESKDLEDAYKLGKLNALLELTKKLQGYPVNGLVRGIITEEVLTNMLVEVENEN